MSMKLHGGMQGEIPGVTAADIKVLVKPPVGLDKETAFLPWDDNFFFALFPHDRVTFPSRNDDGSPRAVAVGLLVGLCRKHRHVGRHLGVGKLNVHTSASGAAPDIRLQLV